jgi:transposase InsO family protein
VTHDDVLTGYRRRLFTLADEIGVRPACRAMGVHHSTYYRLKRQVDRFGLEALNVRERRRPRMPNQIGPHIEQRIIAFALARPGFGPRRISSELRREKWGGIRVSEHGVWRVLRRFNLNTKARRLALDCFYVGRLSGSKGTVWQYTAADVASGFVWAELHSSDRNPRARWTSELCHRVARELRAAGWRLQEVTTDNGSEFASKEFGAAVEAVGARQWRIKAGRPNSNGCVERAQLTILEECWRPAFARSLAPKITALRRDLDEYLDEFNFDRAHNGRLTRGRVPGEIVYGARKMGQVR